MGDVADGYLIYSVLHTIIELPWLFAYIWQIQIRYAYFKENNIEHYGTHGVTVSRILRRELSRGVSVPAVFLICGLLMTLISITYGIDSQLALGIYTDGSNLIIVSELMVLLTWCLQIYIYTAIQSLNKARISETPSKFGLYVCYGWAVSNLVVANILSITLALTKDLHTKAVLLTLAGAYCITYLIQNWIWLILANIRLTRLLLVSTDKSGMQRRGVVKKTLKRWRVFSISICIMIPVAVAYIIQAFFNRVLLVTAQDYSKFDYGILLSFISTLIVLSTFLKFCWLKPESTASNELATEAGSVGSPTAQSSGVEEDLEEAQGDRTFNV